MPLPQLELKIRATGRHPWFYRKMVRKPDRVLAAGSAVLVRDRDGKKLGTGFYNPRTELALRMLDDGVVEDAEAFLVQRLMRALQLREKVLDLPQHTNAYRVLHSEGDGFPGLILDKLGTAYVAVVHSLAMQQRLEPLGEWLKHKEPGCQLALLQDAEAMRREGMDKLPPPRAISVEVHEHGIRYAVAGGTGHKTGFFADQRDNRLLLRSLSKGRSVLDLCCNSGGFAMNALLGGALRVRAADLDEAAVAQTQANLERNKLKADTVHADAFDLLRQTQRGQFDLIVLDPPKWVHNKEEFEEGMARYRDLNRLAFQKLDAGGLLVTCSCSGSVSEEQFVRMLRDAAADAGVDARTLYLRGAGPDHPIALECLETRYLKVAFVAVR